MGVGSEGRDRPSHPGRQSNFSDVVPTLTVWVEHPTPQQIFAFCGKDKKIITAQTKSESVNCTCSEMSGEFEWLFDQLHHSRVITKRERGTHHCIENTAPVELKISQSVTNV